MLENLSHRWKIRARRRLFALLFTNLLSLRCSIGNRWIWFAPVPTVDIIYVAPATENATTVTRECNFPSHWSGQYTHPSFLQSPLLFNVNNTPNSRAFVNRRWTLPRVYRLHFSFTCKQTFGRLRLLVIGFGPFSLKWRGKYSSAFFGWELLCTNTVVRRPSTRKYIP